MTSLIVIKRVAILEEGAFGVMLMLGTPFAVTLERTFDDGQPVIPAGRYVCKPRRYNRGGYQTYEITGVEGHSLLLFHKANWETDLEGCVGIGESFETLDGRIGIAQSSKGFIEFMDKVGDLPSFSTEFQDC